VICAFKSRLTVKYAHKVAYRTGMHAMYFAFGLGILLLTFLYGTYETWLADSKPEEYYKTTLAVLPFALGAGIVAVFYRVAGIIYERTSGIGEVVIF